MSEAVLRFRWPKIPPSLGRLFDLNSVEMASVDEEALGAEEVTRFDEDVAETIEDTAAAEEEEEERGIALEVRRRRTTTTEQEENDFRLKLPPPTAATTMTHHNRCERMLLEPVPDGTAATAAASYRPIAHNALLTSDSLRIFRDFCVYFYRPILRPSHHEKGNDGENRHHHYYYCWPNDDGNNMLFEHRSGRLFRQSVRLYGRQNATRLSSDPSDVDGTEGGDDDADEGDCSRTYEAAVIVMRTGHLSQQSDTLYGEQGRTDTRAPRYENDACFLEERALLMLDARIIRLPDFPIRRFVMLGSATKPPLRIRRGEESFKGMTSTGTATVREESTIMCHPVLVYRGEAYRFRVSFCQNYEQQRPGWTKLSFGTWRNMNSRLFAQMAHLLFLGCRETYRTEGRTIAPYRMPSRATVAALPLTSLQRDIYAETLAAVLRRQPSPTMSMMTTTVLPVDPVVVAALREYAAAVLKEEEAKPATDEEEKKEEETEDEDTETASDNNDNVDDDDDDDADNDDDCNEE